MDLNVQKTYQISTDYKDRRNAPNWESRQFAEVVFIDKTHLGPNPLVYQLKDTYSSLESILNACKFHPASFTKEAFVLLGESVSIEKKSKQILLTNNNIVNYSHLVIVSGKKPLLSFEDEELVVALQALGDAMRVKPKIPDSFANPAQRSSPFNPSFFHPNGLSVHEKSSSANEHAKQNIEKLVHPFIASANPQDNTFELNTQRFYEVQI